MFVVRDVIFIQKKNAWYTLDIHIFWNKYLVDLFTILGKCVMAMGHTFYGTKVLNLFHKLLFKQNT